MNNQLMSNEKPAIIKKNALNGRTDGQKKKKKTAIIV
jgi:hypothetical protein